MSRRRRVPAPAPLFGTSAVFRSRPPPLILRPPVEHILGFSDGILCLIIPRFMTRSAKCLLVAQSINFCRLLGTAVPLFCNRLG